MAGGCSRRKGKGLCGLSDGQCMRTESVWDSMMAELSCARCNVLTDGPTNRGLLCSGRVAVEGRVKRMAGEWRSGGSRMIQPV